MPGPSDNVVIPAGISVTILPGDSEMVAGVTLRGTLALGDANSTLDASGLAASGGTITGPQNAAVTVTLGPAALATVDGAGLTVDGANLDVAGNGGLAIAGPLTIVNGGWFESEVGTSWTSTAPWTLGGADGSLTSMFSESGAQLTISAAASARTAQGAGDGVIELDNGATLSKQDATTTTLAVDVVLSASVVQVIAGKLVGGFQGDAALSLSSGAVLGFSGSGLQLSSSAVNVTAGTFEVEPGADVSLDLPANPGLHQLNVGAGASLDVAIGSATGPVSAPTAPEMLADATALAAGSTLSIDGGAGTLSLGDQDVLSGSGALDGTLANAAGTVAPHGALEVTGDFSQAATGTLAVTLRTPGDGDLLSVDGAATLGGTLHAATSYAPAATASQLVLGSPAKPAGTFAKTLAPLSAGRSWQPVYDASGVTLALGANGGSGGSGAGGLARPALLPSKLIVGVTARCVPAQPAAASGLTFAWLRSGKPIAGATKARYHVGNADRGRALTCRVTAKSGATGTSLPARARTGLGIGAAIEHGGRTVTVALHCAASEKSCDGSLRVVVAGHAVAGGSFALHTPGGLAHLKRIGRSGLAAGAAVVRASYRNGAGATRAVTRRLALTA